MEENNKYNIKTIKGKYIQGKEIGNGSGGTVYEGSGILYPDIILDKIAIKVDKNKSYNRSKSECALLEIISNQCNNIIKIYDMIIYETRFVMIMEYCEGDLHSFLKKRTNIKPIYSIFELKLNWTHQIITGLKFLHSKNIMHRDIKPQNILIYRENDLKWILKLTDFGISKESLDGSYESTLLGTENYQAPELWRPVPRYTKLVDVWAFGIVLLELFCDDSSANSINKDLINPCYSEVSIFNSNKFIELLYRRYPIIKEYFNSLIPMIFQFESNRSDMEQIDNVYYSLYESIIITYNKRIDCLYYYSITNYTKINQLFNEDDNDPLILVILAHINHYSNKIVDDQLLKMDLTDSLNQFIIGLVYYDGLGIDEDIKQALFYFNLSADQGNSFSQFFIGLYEQTTNKDYKKARYYFEQSSNNISRALYTLGNCYYMGIGVFQDFEEAFKYYKLAAIRCNNRGQCNLGLMYKYGVGTDKDETLAEKYSKLSIENGLPKSFKGCLKIIITDEIKGGVIKEQKPRYNLELTMLYQGICLFVCCVYTNY